MVPPEQSRTLWQRLRGREPGMPHTPNRRWRYLAALGPGIIAANAGNDAGGIATYSQAGATFGYQMLWVMVVITIGLVVVQDLCARLGAVTGKGFSDLVRENFSLRMTVLILLTIVVANVGLIVSEFIGIAAAAEIFGVSRLVAVPAMAVLLWLLVTRGSYNRVERVFLLFTLVFLAYIGAAFLSHPDWNSVFRSTFIPTFRGQPGYIGIVIALIGTTITPYMQIYVQSSVVERGVTVEELPLTRVDVFAGSLFSDLISGFIIIATASTLFPRGITVESASDAALALAPIAGPYALVLFAVGLLGASLLAAGVLPLATTYVLSEAFGFERGVSRTWSEAPIFLGAFTTLMAVGAAIALLPNLPFIKVLIGLQQLNGIVLPVELFAILRLMSNQELMGSYHIRGGYKLLAWTVAALLSLLSLAYLTITALGYFGIDLGI
ncbi:MAG: Nramp family divalent metal transporter [Herpetosiphon sp.]